uniref:Ig-like domain-containing protein n=1 Tax=Megaselia scalaris TaxID=36166 RepID=T1GWQ0_MEGSC
MPGGGQIIYGDTLIIKKSHRLDRGNYLCIADNQVGKPTKRPPPLIYLKKTNVTLFVKHSPIILESKTLAEHIVTEGQKLEAVCQAEGFPKPSISWKREDNAIMPGGGQIIYGDTLIIKKSHRLDRGNYLCIADNQVGKPTKRLVRIDVEFPPKTFVPSPKRAQALGYYVTLECAAQGYPATSVNWFKDDVELKTPGLKEAIF